MNATKSWIVGIIVVAIFAASIWGFAHGAQMETTGLKVGWMLGSLGVLVLTVFLTYQKFFKK